MGQGWVGGNKHGADGREYIYLPSLQVAGWCSPLEQKRSSPCPCLPPLDKGPSSGQGSGAAEAVAEELAVGLERSQVVPPKLQSWQLQQ